jgi:hypothetical protein
MQSTRYSCHILIKFEASRQILLIYSSIKFHENRPLEAELFDTYIHIHIQKRTEGRTGMTKLIITLPNLRCA